MTRPRRRRRDLRWPLQLGALLLSCPPKRYLAAATDGSRRAKPVGLDPFKAWVRRHQLWVVENACIEWFFCQEYQIKQSWQVRLDSSGALGVHHLPDGVMAWLQEMQRQLK